MILAVVIAVAAAAALLIAGGLLVTLRRREGELRLTLDELRARSAATLTEVHDERERLIAALNSSVDAVIALDGEGDIAFANTAAEGLFQRSQDELLGNSFALLLPNEDVRDAIRATGNDGQRHTALIDQPGRTYLRVFTSALPGDEWPVLVVIDDLTDVKRTEQVRRDFVANVSHELRTPLASLKSVVETLASGALEDEVATKEFLQRADGEIDRMVQIMEELLELSRIESGEVPMAMERINLTDVLAHAVNRLQLQARRQSVQLSLAPFVGDFIVNGDADRLERVAVNLIDNALKFTDAGGWVRVEAERPDQQILVRVRDNGRGIAPADLPRVFERFYKADRARSGGGTGLGLAIVKHTVEAHGGRVWVESELNGGSLFSFELPAS